MRRKRTATDSPAAAARVKPGGSACEEESAFAFNFEASCRASIYQSGASLNALTAGRYERGRILFNAGRFFEAHEVWEEAWMVERGDVRTALQGLIQIAAGYYKAQGDQPAPCARLLEAGLSKLAAGRLADGGFPDLETFAAGVRENLVAARRWKGGHAAGVGPAPDLPPLPGVQSL
jgi:hypothetical protein